VSKARGPIYSKSAGETFHFEGLVVPEIRTIH
jgi:hypothetical protein